MVFIPALRPIYACCAIACASLALNGCNAADVQIDAPILEAAGINLTSKKIDDANVPERPGIVIPPSTQTLPEPGTRSAAAQPSWPQDPDQIKARKVEAAAKAKEEYCIQGKWKEKADISEFEKDTSSDVQRCPSKLGESVSKALSGGDTTDEQ